jgi:hypothetical protein
VEDTEMNYWLSGETYGLSTRYGRQHPESMINKMKALVDVANREFRCSLPTLSPTKLPLD